MIPLGVLASARVAPTGGGDIFTPTYSAASGQDASTYTWPGVDIGAPHAARTVLVAVAASRNAGRSLTSVTIGGNPATIDVSRISGSWYQSAVARLQVPAGSTADIVVTYSNTMDRAFLFVWSVPAALSVIGTGQGDNTAVTVSPTTNTGLLFGIHYHVIQPSTSVTGATTRGTEAVESRPALALADPTSDAGVTLAPSVMTGSTIAAVAYGYA